MYVKKGRPIKHGLHHHRLYGTWNSMMHRCHKIKEGKKDYVNYRGRGIKVCERWHDVKAFIEDMYPSFQEGLELDRKDNNGNYDPDNCRWVTTSKNQKNRRDQCNEQSEIDHVHYDKKHDYWKFTTYFKTKEEAEIFGKLFNRYIE